MAIEQKEIYVVRFEDGTAKNVVAATYQEVIQMYGEENIVSICKLNYEEDKK